MFLVLYSTAFADGKKSENKDNQKKYNLIWKKVEPQEKDHKSGIKWEKYKNQSDEETYQIEIIKQKLEVMSFRE